MIHCHTLTQNDVETAMFRFETIHGPGLFSRKNENPQKEASMKIKTLNIMTAQGMPVSIPKMTP
jgi:hypothetical protein